MKQPLNFNWSFIDEYKEEYLEKLDKNKIQSINIPHNPTILPYNYFSEESYQKIVTYEKLFDVDNFVKEDRYFLNFEGFMFLADIYLNNHYLGKYYSGYFPVNIEVTQYIKEKNNRLVVILDSRENKDYPPFGFAIDYLTFSGIYREVNLYHHLPNYLSHFYIHGDMKGDIEVIYEVDGNEKYEIEHFLYDQEDKLIISFKEDKYHLDNPILWDISNPYLYKLKTVITVANRKEEYINKFGFKEARFTNKGFYLNDKYLKLVGLNRHQAYPYMGYAASKSLQEDDAVLLKKTGLNVVRTSHYPQSEHFLNKCDEIGLLVIDEIPGWQHVGQSELWRENCVNNTKRMVLKERNHPSVIAYGVRIDESVDDHDLYTKTNKIAHELDKYRPTIGVRNFTTSELLEDIYGYNDFVCDSLNKGLIKPNKVKHNNKAYLVTEYLGHMYPVKPTSDISLRKEIALRHAKVIDDNYKHDSACGAIGWCFVDYQSHTDFGSGDHLCTHGVYDIYRNPKLSSYIYASQQDEYPVLEVLSNFKPGDVPAAILDDIYVVTNAEYIELYSDNQFVKRFYPKNDRFKYLKHPPILIDDIIGETFDEPKFPKRVHQKMAKMLSYAAIHGTGNLPLNIKLYLFHVMTKYKVNYTELVSYWIKYVGTWGGKAKTYKIKAFKKGVLQGEIELGPSNTFHMDVSLHKSVLRNEETYDTLSIKIKYLDEHNRLAEYANRIVNVATTGPISIVGPSSQSLLGGQLTLYFNSKNEKGTAKISIEIDNQKQEFEIEVK